MQRTFDIVMRVVTTLVGLLMVLTGSVWMMQGLGVGPAVVLQGFMVNDLRWTLYGGLLAIVGLAEIVWSWLRTPSAR